MSLPEKRRVTELSLDADAVVFACCGRSGAHPISCRNPDSVLTTHEEWMKAATLRFYAGRCVAAFDFSDFAKKHPALSRWDAVVFLSTMMCLADTKPEPLKTVH